MSYPATYSVETPERIDNWRPLVQWFLAIPHAIVLWFLGIVAGVVAVISWFSILFTGRLSESLAATQCMVIRYTQRVTAYVGFLHEQYPPFDFTPSAEDTGGPVVVEFTPELENRNRLTAGLRLIWAIPIAIFGGVIYWVAEVLWIIAFFAVLFTGKWPEGLRDFIVKALRLNVKVNAYVLLLTDQYPEFTLE